MSPFPPPPNVDPPPPLGWWAVLDVKTTYGDPRSVIAFLTDVPVHLFMQLSYEPPAPQTRLIKVRGVWKKGSTFWKMRPGPWFEQREYGDTTEHTWYVEQWPVGGALWYYLDGRQQGRDTVSTSILFGSVRPAPNFNPDLGLLFTVRIGSPLQFNISAATDWQQSINVAP